MVNKYHKNCTLCGTPVKVVGNTTLHYESAYNEIHLKALALTEALEKCVAEHSNRKHTYGWHDVQNNDNKKAIKESGVFTK